MEDTGRRVVVDKHSGKGCREHSRRIRAIDLNQWWLCEGYEVLFGSGDLEQNEL